MRLEDLMERAAQYDENLARDIKDYVHGRKYGLVYEASKPEFVRMWKKPVVRGDIVNILPPRGVMEDTKNEDDPSEIVYKVISISDGIAMLRNEQTGETVTAFVDDIVALARFDKPIYAGLKETGRVERGGDKPYHVVINGENYHALQTLVYAYQGQVDCIYIDPPYNTGATDWRYNNNYVGKDDKYRHSKWLTFMEDRLRLAKKLLNPKKSILIVTIDEKEYLRLGLLLEQLFPEAKVTMVSSVINPAGAGRGREFFRTNEFLFFVQVGEALPVAESRQVENIPVIWDTLRRSSLANARGKHGKGACGPNQFFPIYVDDENHKIKKIGKPLAEDEPIKRAPKIKGCTAVFPIRPDGTEMNWGITDIEAKKRLAKGYLRVGKREEKEPQKYVISYLTGGIIKDIENGTVVVEGYEDDGSIIAYYPSGKDKMATTQWTRPHHDAQRYGTNIVKEMIPGRNFPYPKSLYAVEDCLRLFLLENKKALVVDFFAGSGTTAHAVMRLNHQDEGRRRTVIVTNNEVSPVEAKQLTEKGLRQGDDEWEEKGICRFNTIPRIISAITGKDSNGKALKLSYGIDSECYVIDDESTVVSVNKKTGKPLQRVVYKRTKAPDPLVFDRFPMSEGFEENAIFFDLEYLEPSVVSADLTFDRIAPILWLAGGCKGAILQRQKGYVIGENYAVLFDPRYKTRFVNAVLENKEIKTVFIVTDAAERYRSLCTELPGCRVMQLYESYLRSFEINAIG